MHTFRMHAVIQSRMQTISMIDQQLQRNFNEICKVKARLREVLQITSAQQHTPIDFTLSRL